MWNPVYNVVIRYPEVPEEGGTYSISFTPPGDMEQVPNMPNKEMPLKKGEYHTVIPLIDKGETQSVNLDEARDWPFAGLDGGMSMRLVEPMVFTPSSASFCFELRQYEW
jgi:hypothetical protein